MIVWLARLEAEIDNLRTALDWAFEADEQAALEMCVALGAYWRSRSRGSEGVDRMKQAVDLVRRWRTRPSSEQAADRSILAAGVMTNALSMVGYAGWTSVAALADETLAVARASGDRASIADALVLAIQVEIMTRDAPRIDELRASGHEALQLASGLDDATRLALVQSSLAMIEAGEDLDAAEAWLEGATEAARRSGNPAVVAGILQMRGHVASRAGHQVDAQRWFREAIPQYQAVGDERFGFSVKSELAHALRRSGETEAAAAEYRQTIRGWQRTGNRGAVANQLESLAFTALALGHASRAARLLGAAEALREAAGDPMTSHERVEYDAEVELLRAHLDAVALDEAWADGRNLTEADAVALAVAE